MFENNTLARDIVQILTELADRTNRKKTLKKWIVRSPRNIYFCNLLFCMEPEKELIALYDKLQEHLQKLVAVENREFLTYQIQEKLESLL